jgi:hydrogenase expression/formation protein HypD
LSDKTVSPVNPLEPFRHVRPGQVDALKTFAFPETVKIMEVCGTHTVSIHRYGVHRLLPGSVKLVSGPGCPVCVTPDTYIDEAVFLARQGFLIATFGDMVKVPGTESSLEYERAQGHEIKIVYSPLDALRLAENTDKEVVFLSVGFETTTPGIAVAVKEASERGIKNFSLLAANRLVPPALITLIKAKAQIHGFLLPGHVSTMLGKIGYDFLEELEVPGVISGFEPVDMVDSIILLLNLIKEKKGEVVNNYKRVVRDEGNPKSNALVYSVFEETDAEWRGIGMMEKSGLKLRPEYSHLDARNRIDIKTPERKQRTGCKCGEVLKGVLDPPDCPLFKTQCHPENPIGPCMVSSEGSCSAWYKYG